MAFMATQRVETAVQTNQIMARFRPIAPKPVQEPSPAGSAGSAVLSLQSRSRKRGRRDLLPLSTDKRLRGMQSYPLLPPRHASPCTPSPEAAALSRPFPVERDLLSKLQEPKVIVPRPARPVRTTICVDTSSVTGANSAKLAVGRMAAEQLEVELERDALPAAISGPGNRVRRVNDAYKALVGQPVCPWLDSLPGGAGASRRINGEVVLDVRRFTSTEPTRAGAGRGFSCSSRITWERDGALASVAAPCDVMRLEDCSSGENLFVWRFDITRASVFYCPA